MVIHITTLKAIGKRDNLYCIASSYCSFWRNLMVCQKRKLIDRKIKDRALYLINRIISGAGRRSHLFVVHQFIEKIPLKAHYMVGKYRTYSGASLPFKSLVCSCTRYFLDGRWLN